MLFAAAQQLLRGLDATFIEALLPPKENLVDLIATHVFSTASDEDYAWLGQVAQLVKATDELPFDAPDSTSGRGFNVVNEKYWGGLQIKRDDLNDEKTGGLHQRIVDLAVRAMHHSNKQLTDLLINGDVDDTVANGGGQGYDGKPLFYASHPARGKQTATQGNIVTQTGTTTALVQADIASGIALLYSFLDEANEPANESFSELFIKYPLAMHKPISEAVMAGIISNTTNVQFSTNNIKLIRSARLTADDANDFYMGFTDTPVRGLIYQDREPVTSETNENGDIAFTQEIYGYKARKRSVALPGRWDRIVKVA